MKVLHSICQQIWKTQQWPQDRKRSVCIPISKKGNLKECSNYRTIALPSLWLRQGSWESAGTGKPLPLTTTASRGLEGRGQSLLGSLLPLLSGFLVRFTELAKTEREAKRDLGTSGPSARIFMANSSQLPNPDPRTERGDLTLLCFSTSWVSFLSPNGQTLSSHLNKWQLHSFSCSGPKL